MRKVALLVLLALLVAGAIGGGSARADSYCFSSGIVINGEPWLSHRSCVDCPIGQDCPGFPRTPIDPDPDNPG